MIIRDTLLVKNFNKLTAENFAARLKQANVVSKTDFDNQLIKSYKTKYLELKNNNNNNKLNSLNYFTSNDESQNTFVYQLTLDTLEFKKVKALIIFLIGNQRNNIILNLSNFIMISYIA